MTSPATAYGEHRFEAGYTLRIAATVAVVGLLVGLWAAASNDPSFSRTPFLWVSIVAVTALAVLWLALSKSALIISDAGVRRESLFGSQEMAWSQINETRYRVVPVNLYVHFGLIGMLIAMSNKSSKSVRAQITLELVDSDGKKLRVTSNYRNGDEAIGIILARLMPPKVQAVKSRLQRGETVQFGPVGLSAIAVIWRNSTIPVSEITKAELAGTNLQIKRQGKWMSAVSVRSDKVPDVLVFLEVLETLAPQVKASGVDPLARVRI